MNLSQILEALPPRVYLRSGELVIQFSNPTDLLSRVAETQERFGDIDRGEATKPDGRGRGRRSASSAGNGSNDVAETSRGSDE